MKCDSFHHCNLHNQLLGLAAIEYDKPYHNLLPIRSFSNTNLYLKHFAWVSFHAVDLFCGFPVLYQYHRLSVPQWLLNFSTNVHDSLIAWFLYYSILVSYCTSTQCQKLVWFQNYHKTFGNTANINYDLVPHDVMLIYSWFM